MFQGLQHIRYGIQRLRGLLESCWAAIMEQPAQPAHVWGCSFRAGLLQIQNSSPSTIPGGMPRGINWPLLCIRIMCIQMDCGLARGLSTLYNICSHWLLCSCACSVLLLPQQHPPNSMATCTAAGTSTSGPQQAAAATKGSSKAGSSSSAGTKNNNAAKQQSSVDLQSTELQQPFKGGALVISGSAA